MLTLTKLTLIKEERNACHHGVIIGSKKICFKKKNGLEGDVCGVCSENVYPLEDTCWLHG